MEVSRIPGSGSAYPGAVEEYLSAEAATMGLSARKDEGGNIIIEKPAAPGFEAVPEVVIECSTGTVANQGAIEVDYRANQIFTYSDLLDAPRNLGVASALAILKNADDCGKVTAVFIRDNADDPVVSGAASCNLSGAPYLIGFCGTSGMNVYTGAPSAELVKSSAPIVKNEPKGRYAYVLVATGFPESKSTYNISPVEAISRIFSEVSGNGVYFELASFEAISTPLSVPNTATAVVVVDEYEKKKFASLFKTASRDYIKSLPSEYGNAQLLLIDTRVPAETLSRESTDMVTAYLYALFNNGKAADGSAAVAVQGDDDGYPVCTDRISLSGDSFTLGLSISGHVESVDDIIAQQVAIGEFTGVTLERKGRVPGFSIESESSFASDFLALLKETVSNGKPELTRMKSSSEVGLILSSNETAGTLLLGWDVKSGPSGSEYVSLRDIEAPAEAVLDFIYTLAHPE